MKKFKLKIAVIAVLSLVVGLLFGGWLFSDNETSATETETQHEHSQLWTCSMHPQVRKKEPGQCPICGMDLIPLQGENQQDLSPETVSMSATALQLAQINTTTISRKAAIKKLRLNGRVKASENLMKTQSSHLKGRIERLWVSSVGEELKKGEKIAKLFSPELIKAQRELLQAHALRKTQPALYEAARSKLKAWRLSDNQIEEIIAAQSPIEQIPVYADKNGVVILQHVQVGDYVTQGQALFTLAELDPVWLEFDAYESDLPFLNKGQELRFTVASLPEKEFRGKVIFIDPVVDPKTRTARIRVAATNKSGLLKPQMFATAKVSASLGQGEHLVVPKSAVMWTGERSVVYIAQPGKAGAFKLREIKLGAALEEEYVVEEGLEAGEEVVMNGTFTVDAAAQLAGKPSMMNPATDRKEKPEEDESPAQLTLRAEQKQVLNNFLTKYLDLKDALVVSNQEKAALEAEDMKSRLGEIERNFENKAARKAWNDYHQPLQTALQSINKQANIDSQRKAFISLSASMVNLVKRFDLGQQPLFEMYCPMADNNTGANWLSTEPEVKNPYYGDLMLRCGKIKSTIQ